MWEKELVYVNGQYINSSMKGQNLGENVSIKWTVYETINKRRQPWRKKMFIQMDNI